MRAFYRLALLLILVLAPAQGWARDFCGNEAHQKPLSEPVYSKAFIINWASLAAVETMTFGFHDYRMRLQDSSRFFTPKGFKYFSKGVEKARLIERIETNKLVLNGAPKAAPIIEQEGVVKGRYQWAIQIPFVQTYRTGHQVMSDNVLIKLTVTRSDDPNNREGIGISEWLSGPYQGQP